MNNNGTGQMNGRMAVGIEPATGWKYGAIPSVRQMFAATAEPKNKMPPLPQIEDAAAMLANPLELPPELIAGLLHQGAKMVIGGGSKSFKTWVLLDLALSVATGAPWLEHPTKQGRALYMNLEIQPGFFCKRITEVVQAKDIALIPGQLDVWNLRGHAADLASLMEQILERMGRKYALIVVDPIYKALGGRDENKAGDIAILLNELERLAVQSGAAVVFGAHFSKGNQAGKESMDRIGGSGVFARDPDSILILTRHEEENAFTVESTLRNHAPVAPFVVRWQFPLMRRDNTLNPAKLKQVGGRGKKYTTHDLLETLDPAGLTTSQWVRRAFERTSMSESSFHRLMDELKRESKIKESPYHKGRWIIA